MDFWRVGRIAVILCGAWLFVSGLLFEHTPDQLGNALVVGATAVLVELVALRWWPQVYVIDVVLAIWLFVSLWALPGRSAGVVVNDMIVATLMFGFSVFPPDEKAIAGRRLTS